MFKKLLTLIIAAGMLSLSACQEDTTMEELIQDTELDGNGGSGGGDDTFPPGGG